MTSDPALRGLRAAAGCALAALVLGGCSITIVHGNPAAANAADSGARADTLRGTVEVVGAEPMTRLVLRTPDGAVDLAGDAADPLRGVRGIEVTVRGRDEDDRFVTEGFHVRSVDGLPAADGRLEIDEGRAVLVDPDGSRTVYGTAPTSLRAHAGRRVWIAGRPGAEPQAWGLIEQR